MEPPVKPDRRSTARAIVIAGAISAILGGAGLLTYGAWLIYHPAAFVLAGLLLLAEGLNEARR